jgi:predicted MFS family arabinose efflux permease
MIALGCFFEICRTGTVALLQTSVADALRGRVMSTQFLLLRLAGAIGVAVIGASAEDWGLRAPMLCCAALAFLAWGATFRARDRIVAAFSASDA